MRGFFSSRFPVYLLIAALLVLVFIVATDPLAYQVICEQGKPQGEPNCYVGHKLPYLIFVFFETANKYGNALMVFVTIGLGAIAIFQLIGNARQAEHLTKLERPYLFVEPTFELPKAFAMYETANVEAETIKVVFDMVNHGRTPAIIKIIDARLVFLTHPPSRRPTHTHWNENEGVIEGKSREKGIEVSYAKAFTPFDRQGYEKRQASFWFIGAIVYDDMFNTEHVTNFRYRWMPKTQKLVMHGGNQHNKRS